MMNERMLTNTQISKIQLKNLKKTIAYCKNNSSFYKKLLKYINVEDIKKISDIEKLPFTTKDDLSSNFDRFLCVKKKDIVDISTTSGSTGDPLIYKMTDSDMQRLALNEYYSFSCAEIKKTDTVIIAVTLDRCFIAGLAYFLGLKKMGASVVRVGTNSLEMLQNAARDLKATAIVGVPSFLLKISEYAKENGADVRDLNIKKLICIGEPIRERNLELNEFGRRLEKAWNSNVYSTYGITELAVSFCECKYGVGGHSHPDLAYTEIIDENECVLPAGQDGEIVVTTFGVSGMPLIRYKTGDISFIETKRCKCGLITNRLGPIIGRKNQKLKIKGTTVYSNAIINALEKIKGINNYVIIATSLGDLSDNVEIKVSIINKDVLKKIRESLKGSLKVTPIIKVASDIMIDKLKLSKGGRKKVYFIDNRKTDRGKNGD